VIDTRICTPRLFSHNMTQVATFLIKNVICHSERPKGVTLPPGASAGETLRSAQGDINFATEVATWFYLCFNRIASLRWRKL
jgi:hypothetical protein